jgi:tRNA A-37 threonylcarbamoyl transferase component Bud32
LLRGLEGRLREEAEGLGSPISIAYNEPPKNLRVITALAVLEEAEGVRRSHFKLEGWEVDYLLVERPLFEEDVEASTLLDVAAGRLLLPYWAILGGSYLSHWEETYRRRKVLESLRSLILERPELSRELLIDPRYFAYDILMALSHILPQAEEELSSLEKGETPKGFTETLKTLEREGYLHLEKYVSLNEGYVENVLRSGPKTPEQLEAIRRAIKELVADGVNGILELLRGLPLFPLIEEALPYRRLRLPQPERFLYFPTAKGPTNLLESIGVEELVSRLEPGGRAKELELRRVGGVLNEVYLLTYEAEGLRQRAIVKWYPNWTSLKWAPVALWTLGTRGFAIAGRERMERECASTLLLSRGGIPVPSILYASFRDRLLVKEYVEGLPLVEVVKTILKGEGSEKERSALRRVGATLASIHSLGATVGDCKPDDFILSEGELYLVDLEQGSKGGDASWDVAEFLYFSGRYATPFDPLDAAEELVHLFSEGYLEGGGSLDIIKQAGRLKYWKVFTPLTLPQVLYTISKTCAKLSA